MARLTEEAKVLIVQRLACFDSSSRVIEAVRDALGITITPQQVYHYNPMLGTPPAKKWCELFRVTREAYSTSTADVAIAQKTWRLQQLQAQYHKWQDRNPMLAKELLEQAAKEQGDVYTNKRTVDGKLGVTIDDFLLGDEEGEG